MEHVCTPSLVLSYYQLTFNLTTNKANSNCFTVYTVFDALCFVASSQFLENRVRSPFWRTRLFLCLLSNLFFRSFLSFSKLESFLSEKTSLCSPELLTFRDVWEHKAGGVTVGRKHTPRSRAERKEHVLANTRRRTTHKWKMRSLHDSRILEKWRGGRRLVFWLPIVTTCISQRRWNWHSNLTQSKL